MTAKSTQPPQTPSQLLVDCFVDQGLSDREIAKRLNLAKATVVKLRIRAQENLHRRTKFDVCEKLGLRLEFFDANPALASPEHFLREGLPLSERSDQRTQAPAQAPTDENEERCQHLIAAIEQVLREEDASEYEHRALWAQWARIAPKEPANWQDKDALRHAAERLLRTLLGNDGTEHSIEAHEHDLGGS
ncbi:MAG: hypothetical protein ACPGUV_12620 [Polyangiales bacterium]